MKFNLAATALFAMVVATAAAPAPPPAPPAPRPPAPAPALALAPSPPSICLRVCFTEKPSCPTGWEPVELGYCWNCCKEE
ncbi:unnamed protein product [Umbelopsis vinacea]